MKRYVLLTTFLSALSSNAFATDQIEACRAELARIPKLPPKLDTAEVCKSAKQHNQCVSTKGKPIYHYDFDGGKNPSRSILVFALTHGDEKPSGTIAMRWMQRLRELEPRNRWRIVPILNPDGLEANTRVNSNGVDLNRNFPSKNWEAEAKKQWASGKKDPRRFPGSKAASETETLCAMEQISEFRPDFIVSIHTPYGVLDFDGPKVNFPDFKGLPWVSLGTYPGSLGRYMWMDQNIPVLTIELKDDRLLSEIDQVDVLQDISGTVAIRASKKMSSRTN